MTTQYPPTQSQNERFIDKIMRQSALKNAMDFIAQNFQPEQVYTRGDLARSARKNFTPLEIFPLAELEAAVLNAEVTANPGEPK